MKTLWKERNDHKLNLADVVTNGIAPDGGYGKGPIRGVVFPTKGIRCAYQRPSPFPEEKNRFPTCLSG